MSDFKINDPVIRKWNNQLYYICYDIGGEYLNGKEPNTPFNKCKVCEVLPDLYGSVYEGRGWNWNRDCIALLDLKDRKGNLRFVSEDSVRKATFTEISEMKNRLLLSKP